MARIVLVTGGCRSGKSVFAQQLAESLPGRRVFVATCQPLDDEMRQRIEKHRQERSTTNWQTIEEPLDLADALTRSRDWDVVLVDCLTLWISNLLCNAPRDHADMDEERLAGQCQQVLDACRAHPGTILFVTNEVGLGIVPDNALSRRFRDLVGRCNQVIAAAADHVTLMTCGIPLRLKGEQPESTT